MINEYYILFTMINEYYTLFKNYVLVYVLYGSNRTLHLKLNEIHLIKSLMTQSSFIHYK